MNAVPLRRNRDFMLLQTGQLLSSAGAQLTGIAYPLLVLALTGSATKAVVVSRSAAATGRYRRRMVWVRMLVGRGSRRLYRLGCWG